VQITDLDDEAYALADRFGFAAEFVSAAQSELVGAGSGLHRVNDSRQDHAGAQTRPPAPPDARRAALATSPAADKVKASSALGTPSEGVCTAAGPPQVSSRAIEIRDAVLALSDHASNSLRDQARAHEMASGLIGAQADIATEACWIIGAKESRQRNEPPSGEPLPPASGGRDLPSEIHALKQLARAYDSDLTRTFAAKLDRARTLETTQ
jgi:hypothetical protein